MNPTIVSGFPSERKRSPAILMGIWPPEPEKRETAFNPKTWFDVNFVALEPGFCYYMSIS